MEQNRIDKSIYIKINKFKLNSDDKKLIIISLNKYYYKIKSILSVQNNKKRKKDNII